MKVYTRQLINDDLFISIYEISPDTNLMNTYHIQKIPLGILNN